jgi:hypothetical protein
MRSTTLASKVNENTAAAVMLTAPAIVVASRMEMSVESILKPQIRAGQYFTALTGFLPKLA